MVGAMVGFLVTQSNFGMASVIGLLFLLGLLDKNALLLMDYANQLRQVGLSRTAALMKTGPSLSPHPHDHRFHHPRHVAPGPGLGGRSRIAGTHGRRHHRWTDHLHPAQPVVVPVLYTLLEDGWMSLRPKRSGKG
jgi:hypothetical protein